MVFTQPRPGPAIRGIEICMNPITAYMTRPVSQLRLGRTAGSGQQPFILVLRREISDSTID